MGLKTRVWSMGVCPEWPGRSPARAGTVRLSSACARGTDTRRRCAMTANKAAIRWCAVYTCKSSEEGLEQQFNSLHAQREAAEAYIKSQRHEGWRLLAEKYDDGGYSGGNLERPALKRLVADIRAGKVQTVVVYKVDRLTRSLNDFAQLIELFEARGVTFVSVTHQFTTPTSMPLLMLHFLLPFAHSQPEVT